MRRITSSVLLAIVTLLGAGTILARGYEWRDHAAPFDFQFSNHIDTHQQSKLTGKNKLVGFFYIRFNGEFTDDGVPIAQHANCGMVPDECTVGWQLHGVPVQATLLAHEEGMHPTWCVDPDDVPSGQGYSHFHWLDASEHAGGLVPGQTYDGYLLKLTATDTFFFRHHRGFLVTPGHDVETHANIMTDCP